MVNEVEDAKNYIIGVMGSLENYSDAKRIEILTEKVEFWYRSSKFWKNEFKEAKKEKVI